MIDVVEKIYLINFMDRSSKLWYIFGTIIHNFRPFRTGLIFWHQHSHSRYQQERTINRAHTPHLKRQTRLVSE